MLFLLTTCVGAVGTFAQEERPEIIPQKTRPQPARKTRGKEPRAVGILQLNSGGKGDLIPVAILINGRFYDASAYKADPVPMALETGTVYEAEQTGDSQGLFTVNGALHSKNTGGTGTYLPQGSEALKTTRKAENVPVGMDNSGDEPPRLTRKEGAKTAEAGAGAGSAPASGTPTGTSSGTPTGTAGEKPADKGAGQTTGDVPADKKDSTAKEQTAPDQTTPDQSSKNKTSGDEASENYYRPTLRRGKPTEAAPEDKEEAVKAPAGGEAAAGTSAAGATAVGAPVRLVPAISDAAGPEPQSYKFFWKTGEEDERRKQMLALAADEVRGYVAALAKNHISANPVGPKTAAGHKAGAKQAKPVLESVEFHGFDLWLTNQPVMILTAVASIPGWTEAGTSAAGGTAGPYNITLVARTDIYGDLRKLYSGVTDKYHLDVTPQLELIDAVDADGDGLGELLFRKTSDVGTGYVIYRATADKLWKMFDGLNPE